MMPLEFYGGRAEPVCKWHEGWFEHVLVVGQLVAEDLQPVPAVEDHLDQLAGQRAGEVDRRPVEADAALGGAVLLGERLPLIGYAGATGAHMHICHFNSSSKQDIARCC